MGAKSILVGSARRKTDPVQPASIVIRRGPTDEIVLFPGEGEVAVLPEDCAIRHLVGYHVFPGQGSQDREVWAK